MVRTATGLLLLLASAYSQSAGGTAAGTTQAAVNPQPAYFALAGVKYNGRSEPIVAVGVHTKDMAYTVLSLEQPIKHNTIGKVEIEEWLHAAQSGTTAQPGRVGLWIGAGLSASNTAASTNAPGYVTFEASVSIRLFTWLELAPGVRASVPLTGALGVSTDKFVAAVHNWPSPKP